MQVRTLTQRSVAVAGREVDSREGRDCEGSRRLTARLLFPRQWAVPGGWLLALAAACTLVAVRAMELPGL